MEKLRAERVLIGASKNIYLGKDESVASLTVSLESLFKTLVIDAYEERDIATFDIPGAYLHANMPEYKNLILNSVDIL